MNARRRIAVILGGRSSEREVSLASGGQVSTALESRGHEVGRFDTDDSLLVSLRDFAPEVAFIALHGRWGEDGCLQGLLELMGVPYAGSGVLASALAMDKRMSRKLFTAAGLVVPPYLCLDADPDGHICAAETIARIEQSFGFPCVVKPNAEGSTIGVTLVKSRDAVREALEHASGYGPRVLVEKYIEGTEVSVPVVGNRWPKALPVVEIVPEAEFYDYRSKYSPGGSEHIIPARLDSSVYARVQEDAVRAYSELGCRGFGRVDVIVAPDGTPYILEMNTLPGMTATSLVPDAARAVGIDFPRLVELFCELALGLGEPLVIPEPRRASSPALGL